MKAVILAAGLSSRISHVTNGTPKCLLSFGGRTILDFQLDGLFTAGADEVAIVVGHGKQHIIHHVRRWHREKTGRVRFIENPVYAETNNMYSLWLAKEWVGQSDFFCLNADVLFHPQILLPAAEAKAPISIILDPAFREETMKAIVRQGRVVAMQKGIPREEASGTYLGITRFSRRVCEPLFGAIEELIAEGRVKDFFQVAVERLIAGGTFVSFTTTGGLPWTEIDDEADLQHARARVYPRLEAALNLCQVSDPAAERPEPESRELLVCSISSW